MHWFAVDLKSSIGSLTEREGSFSAFLVCGSSSRTDLQVFVDDVAIDAFSTRMRSNLVTNCFSKKKKDYYFCDESNCCNVFKMTVN